jgi:hypothetical protein
MGYNVFQPFESKRTFFKPQEAGKHVSIDYKVMSDARITNTGCTVANSVTYSLKEIFIINQFEIR